MLAKLLSIYEITGGILVQSQSNSLISMALDIEKRSMNTDGEL